MAEVEFDFQRVSIVRFLKCLDIREDGELLYDTMMLALKDPDDFTVEDMPRIMEQFVKEFEKRVTAMAKLGFIKMANKDIGE